MSKASKLLLVAALALTPRAAAAQAAGGLETARPLAQKGIELYHDGRTTEALEVLEEAEAAHSAPVHQVYIARAHAKLGHLVEAQRHYKKALAIEPGPGDGAALAAIRDAARRESDALRQRIPTLTVAVTSRDARGEPSATLDGRAVTLSALERGVRLDPGEHSVEVVVPGGPTRQHKVALTEGRGERLDILLDAAGAPTEPADPAPARISDESSSTSPEADGSSRVPAVLAFGVGALGLGVGAVTGALTLSRASEITQTCHDGHCPRDQAARGESAGTLATVSTVSFAIGAVGVVTGVVLLSLRTAPRSVAAAPLRVVVGPGSVAASGSF
jgi:hypothetical protein